MQITFDQMKYRQEVGGRSLTKVGELPISTLLLFFLVLPTIGIFKCESNEITQWATLGLQNPNVIILQISTN